MKRQFLFTICVLLALVSTFAYGSPAIAAAPYALIDLGTLGGSYSEAVAINEVGQIVGHATLAGNYESHAFLWEDGVMTDLGTLGGSHSNASAVNDAGQVIGYSYTQNNYAHAFLWQDGAMTDLGTLGGTESYAIAINEAGQVIGRSFVAGNTVMHPFLWEKGVMIDLGTLGGTYSEARAINEAGQVVGYSYVANDYRFHAFLWEDGVMTDLGTLGGNYSHATAINDSGQVVGLAAPANNTEYHAFLWEDGVMTDLVTLGATFGQPVAINDAGQIIGNPYTWISFGRDILWADGVMIDLGTLGGTDTEAFAINDAGQVVGLSWLAGNTSRHAFLWEDGVMTDLGTLGGAESYAFAINEAGQVTGYSLLANGHVHAFVTVPMNQPPTASAGGPYSVNEGASVIVAASGTDPEAGALTYAWDLDNDGTFENSGQSVTFSAATLDGPSASTINVQVTDEGGLSANDQGTVNVLNVAPTADFTSTPSTLLVGQSATLAFSNAFDPGAADTAAGFFYSYDCTDDGTFEQLNTSDTSYTCAYSDPGTFNALGRIADKDDGLTDYTVQVIVLTPREGTEGLIDQVLELIPGTLNEGQGNALIAKLEGVITQLEKGNTNTAINELEAFINAVNADISAGKLTQEEGQPLLDAANAIIAALGR